MIVPPAITGSLVLTSDPSSLRGHVGIVCALLRRCIQREMVSENISFTELARRVDRAWDIPGIRRMVKSGISIDSLLGMAYALGLQIELVVSKR